MTEWGQVVEQSKHYFDGYFDIHLAAGFDTILFLMKLAAYFSFPFLPKARVGPLS